VNGPLNGSLIGFTMCQITVRQCMESRHGEQRDRSDSAGLTRRPGSCRREGEERLGGLAGQAGEHLTSDMARDTTRKMSFKRTSRRSSHLHGGRLDRPPAPSTYPRPAALRRAYAQVAQVFDTRRGHGGEYPDSSHAGAERGVDAPSYLGRGRVRQGSWVSGPDALAAAH
jgi:hypothetical protein